jgi:hypothetical protein
MLNGAWSGEQTEAAAAHSNLLQLITTIRHVNWVGGVTSVLVSHVWFGGWSFLKLPKTVYILFALGMAVAAYGLAKFLILDRFHSRQQIVVVVLYAMFWLGLLYHVFLGFVAMGVSASCGWYLYAVVVPELLLVTCGLFVIVPKRWRNAVLPALTVAFAAIDLYGVHTLLAPYYTGLIAHLPGSDVVIPARLQQLAAAGPQLILTRLAVNKPALLGPGTIAVLFMAYYLATAVAVGVAFVSASKSESNT